MIVLILCRNASGFFCGVTAIIAATNHMPEAAGGLSGAGLLLYTLFTVTADLAALEQPKKKSAKG